MGERDRDQAAADPVRPALTAARAREVTTGLREVMDDVRRTVACSPPASATLTPLGSGHRSWAAYCAAEFGISRAQAYRLLDVARALGAIHGAVDAGTGTSRTRDTAPRQPWLCSTTACLNEPWRPSQAVAATSRGLSPAASPRSLTTVWAPSMRQRCGRRSARLSWTSAPPRLACRREIAALRRAVDGLAARRYALTGDRRALHGTVL